MQFHYEYRGSIRINLPQVNALMIRWLCLLGLSILKLI